jgi:histidinol phosphatase-like enzyme (inositol monophosphatase family)
MASTDLSLRQLLDIALEVVWEAGKVTLRYFQTQLDVELKSDESPVTLADRETETFLRTRLKSLFPSHAIHGEEYGREGAETASHRWIIDPIDGTKSFLRGIPLYGTMLGLERDGEAVVGAIFFPALDELIGAASGEGCWWNGRRAHVSPCATLADALLLCTDYAHFPKASKQPPFERLCRDTRLQRTWGDCYGHCLVATGRAEVMLDASMKVWDCAALQPILEEAGGTFTDWSGKATIHGPDAMSTNRHLYKAVMDRIA